MDIEHQICEQYNQFYRFAFFLTGSRHDAEDLLQSSVVAILARRSRKQVDDVGAYVRTSIAREYLRSRRRLKSRSDNELAFYRSAVTTSNDAPPSVDHLMSILTQLSPRERAVIVTRLYLDVSITDTATLLNCSVGTIKKLQNRALEKLRMTSTENFLQKEFCNVATDR